MFPINYGRSALAVGQVRYRRMLELTDRSVSQKMLSALCRSGKLPVKGTSLRSRV